MPNAWDNPRCSKVHRFKQCKFYAIEGCICIVDDADGHEDVTTVRKFKERIKAIEEHNRRIKAGENTPMWMLKEREEIPSLLNAMREVVKEAESQGDPMDPKVQAFRKRHYRPRTTSSMVSLAEQRKRSNDPYPELKPLTGPANGRGPIQGTFSAPIPPQYNIHRPPQRKVHNGIQLL